MGKEEKEKGPMDSCPVPVPKVDEGQLLNDCRSPRFFKACQKLQIDPLDLRPKEFDAFAEGPDAVEKLLNSTPQPKDLKLLKSRLKSC